MKKDYVKPEIHYESFVLSQNIAACGIDMNYADANACDPKLDPDFWYGLNDPVFSGETVKCTTKIERIEVYCYTVGTSEAGRTFNS